MRRLPLICYLSSVIFLRKNLIPDFEPVQVRYPSSRVRRSHSFHPTAARYDRQSRARACKVVTRWPAHIKDLDAGIHGARNV
jgi:hypothetical protein